MLKRLYVLLCVLLTVTPLVAQSGGIGGGISSPYASRLRPILAANLGTPTNGTLYYCTDCSVTAPCTGGGLGAVASRVGGAWNCSNGSSGVITATTCTNQFVSAIAASGAATCTTDTLAGAQHANQGTTTTLLHGNASGNPAFGAVVDGDLSLTAPALGTPTSITLTNGTGLPISTGVSGLGANVAAFLATPSSANFAAAVTGETGDTNVMFSNNWTATGLPIIQNTAAAGTLAVFNTSATFKTYISSSTGNGQISVNRNFAGTYDDVNKASAALNIVSATNDGDFEFYTTATNNGSLVSALKIDKNQNINITNQALTAGTMTVTQPGQVRTVVSRFDWTNAMVTALSGTAGDVAVCTLPAKTVVRNAYIVIQTAAGTVTTLSVAVGRTSATYIDYIVASDAKAAANTVYGDASAERGTNLTGYDLPSYTATTLVNAHFISTGGNLSTVTTSTGAIYLETEVLP